MSSSGGSVSSFIGSKWATVAVLAAAAAAGIVVAPAVTGGGSGSTYDCEYADGCFPKPPGSTGDGVVGIPAGTSLSACGSSATISTPGTVIDSCTYTGSLTINANNVTIRKSRIHGSIRTSGSTTGNRFVVEDSEIGAASGCSGFEALIGVRNYEARRNYLHNNGDGFRVSGNDVIIEDNFVILCSNSGDHSDGIQGFGGGSNVVIDHNTIDQRPASSVTAPLFFADFSQPITARNNLLLATSTSSAAIKLHDDSTPDQSGWVVTGNRIIGNTANIGSECTAPKWTWSDNRQVTINSNYDITSTGSLVSC